MATEFLKYPKIKTIGDEENKEVFTKGDFLAIEEKFDGANFRFMFYNGKLIFGSRTQQLTSDEGEDTNVDKNFKRCINYIRENFKPKFKIPLDNFIFYGENCVKHSLSYDWDKCPPFLGFDVYSLSENKFLPLVEKRKIFEIIGLIPIKLVKYGVWGKDLNEDDLVIPTSDYVDAPAEGIVIKNYSKQIFAKKVSDKFKEVNRETFGGNKKYATNDDERIVAMFCTNSRIDKTIFKLLDKGMKLELKMMEFLPIDVVSDIYEENWKEILLSNYKLDMRNIRRLVSKRCLSVLKQVMENNALNEV